MHRKIYEEMGRVCRERKAGGSVLEIGAVPSDQTLLCMPALQSASEKIGINLKGPFRHRDFAIVQGNANDMNCFPDARFDTVLCNAMLEHDKYFWKTIAEIHRVTKPGGLIILCAPGYVRLRPEKMKGFLRRIPLVGGLLRKHMEFIDRTTLTYEVHGTPGDYYRFGLHAFQEVFFEGMVDVSIQVLMNPPRILGSGVKAPS